VGSYLSIIRTSTVEFDGGMFRAGAFLGSARYVLDVIVYVGRCVFG